MCFPWEDVILFCEITTKIQKKTIIMKDAWENSVMEVAGEN